MNLLSKEQRKNKEVRERNNCVENIEIVPEQQSKAIQFMLRAICFYYSDIRY